MSPISTSVRSKTSVDVSTADDQAVAWRDRIGVEDDECLAVCLKHSVDGHRAEWAAIRVQCAHSTRLSLCHSGCGLLRGLPR